MRIPPQTSDIFTFLARGHFISLNSHDPSQIQLYEVIDQHETDLRAYFSAIDLHLHRGPGYFYFSKPESSFPLEERMEKVLRQLDLLGFLLTYHPGFRPGLVISQEEVWAQCKRRPELMLRLEKLPGRGAQLAAEDKLKQLFRLLERDTFLESDGEGRFRVLAAFDYLLQLLDRVDLQIDNHAIRS